MLSSVEGQAYVNFRSCDEGRNRTPAQILKEMDSIYNISITFRDLNARMCGLKQGMMNLSRHITREWPTLVLSWNSVIGTILVRAS